MPFDDGKKTVSGSIAHTDDAAAKVPFVSVKCGIEPTLTGVSSVDMVHGRKNLITAPEYTTITATLCLDLGRNITFSSVMFSFLATNTVVNATNAAIVDFREEDGTHHYLTLAMFYNEKNVQFTANTPQNGRYRRASSNITFRYVYVYYMTNTFSYFTSDSVTEWQLEVGTAVTAFEPYTAPTVSTVNLGRTIYGGTADVVKGEGQETHGKKVFDGTEGTGGTPSWTMISVSQGTMFRITVSDKTTTSATNTRCSYYTPVAQAQRADGTVSGAGTNVDIIDNRFSSVDDFKAWLAENPVTLVYELATPTDFTFTPITPTPETVGKVNNVYCDTGDTELTYYDNAHGFSEVTVNKTGKNLLENNIEDGSTGGISYSKNADGSISCVGTVSNVNATRLINTVTLPIGNYILSGADSSINLRAVLYDGTGTAVTNRNDTGNGVTISVDSTIAYIEFRIKARTASEVVNTIISPMLAVGSSVLPYEPYEAVSKTAYLHKVIYGGQADVVKGTAEPKNILLPSNTDSASTVVNGVARSYSLDSQTWTLEGTNEKTDANWLIYNGANFVVSKTLVVGDTYTYSHTLSDNCYSQFTYKDTNGTTRAIGYLVGNTNKNASVTFTIPSNFVELLRFQIGVVKTATSVSEEAVFQLEKASSKTEYAPYFEPFSFPPISIGTDEGENTLFANEGDSAITYRKDTE